MHGAQTGGSPLGPQQDNQQHGNAPERVGAGCPMGGLSRLTSPTSVGGIQQKPARVRKGREGGRVRNQGQPSARPMPAPEISGRMTRLPSAVGGGRLPDSPPGHPTRTPRKQLAEKDCLIQGPTVFGRRCPPEVRGRRKKTDAKTVQHGWDALRNNTDGPEAVPGGPNASGPQQPKTPKSPPYPFPPTCCTSGSSDSPGWNS